MSGPGKHDVRLLSELTHAIYDAGVHPQHWSLALAAIAASFGSKRALLFTPMLAPQHGGVIFPVGIDEAALQLWASRYIEHDVWAINSTRKGILTTGSAHIDGDIVGRDEFLTSTFYREFLINYDIARVCAGVVFGGSPGLPTMLLSVYRSDLDPRFDADDVRWMQLLIAHVSRAMGITRLLDTLRMQHASLLASFDRLKFGVALLNEHMQVLHLNDAARDVLDRRDGITINANGQLDSQSHYRHDTSITAWLRRLAEAALTEPPHLLDAFVIERHGGGGDSRRYVIQCAPIPAEAHAWSAREESTRYVVFITDPAAVNLPSARQLVRQYGLTRAQAQIALEFAKGGTYKQVAKRVKVSEETVHSHVKEIYAKARVNREPDLVRLVLSLGQSAV